MGARPTRSRSRPPAPPGRHFLPPWLAADLVAGFDIRSDDLVVEIGAGSGRLTRELARVAGVVLAIELDERSAAHLLRASAAWPNVYVRRGDALQAGLPPTPFRVVGNIPFGITTQLLRRVTDERSAHRLDLITQFEPARKRARGRGSVLSVLWGVDWRFSLRRRIPARSFHPAPSVDAAWLVGERRPRPLIDRSDRSAFERLVRRGFAAASAPIERSLGIGPTQARTAAIDPRSRAIDLSVSDWVALFDRVARDRGTR